MPRSHNGFYANDTNSPSVCDEQWMFTDGNNETSRPGLPVVVERRHAIEMGARSIVCRWPIEISTILDSPLYLHGKSERTALVAHGLGYDAFSSSGYKK